MIVEKIKNKGKEISVLEGTDRLQYLIDLASHINSLDQKFKIEENKIVGCASNLWVIGNKQKDNSMLYQFDADAFITKGTAKLVIDILNGEQASEIAELSRENFRTLGILELLTAQRQSGLSNLIDTLVKIAKNNISQS